MVISSLRFVHAWHRHGAHRAADRRKAPSAICRVWRGWRAGLALWCLAFTAAAADPIRIATYATELERRGPGLFLRDLKRGAEDIDFVLTRISEIEADIIVLQGIDYDLGGVALTLLAQKTGYPHSFARAPNTGQPVDVDLDGDGRVGRPRDAQGYGWFSGQGGMAILSRYPIDTSGVLDYSALLWRDMPGATLPQTDAGPFLSEDALAVQRLSTTAHWAVPIVIGARRITLLTAHATPPVFDGPEDRNGLRNADELRLLARMFTAVEGPAVVLGDFNLDPYAGDGRREVMRAFLKSPRLQDPLEELPTADFGADGAGELRVSYVLPTRDFEVTASDVSWKDPPEAMEDRRMTQHHPVWVDLEFLSRD